MTDLTLYLLLRDLASHALSAVIGEFIHRAGLTCLCLLALDSHTVRAGSSCGRRARILLASHVLTKRSMTGLKLMSVVGS